MPTIEATIPAMPRITKSAHPIAKLRAAVGLTSNELGVQLGLNGASIRNIETGRISLPALVAGKLANEFGVSADSIQASTGEPVAIWTRKAYTEVDWHFFAGALDGTTRLLLRDRENMHRAFGEFGQMWFGQFQSPGIRELLRFIAVARTVDVLPDNVDPQGNDRENANFTGQLASFDLGLLTIIFTGLASVQSHEISELREEGKLVRREHCLTLTRRSGGNLKRRLRLSEDTSAGPVGRVVVETVEPVGFDHAPISGFQPPSPGTGKAASIRSATLQ